MPRSSFTTLPAALWAPTYKRSASAEGRSSAARGRSASVTIADGPPSGRPSAPVGEDTTFALYIPRVQHHVPERMVRAVFREIGLGRLGAVRLLPRGGFQSAVVEFEHPFVRGTGRKAAANRALLDAIAAGHVLTVVFDDHSRPWRARRWHDDDQPPIVPPPLNLQPGVLPHPSTFPIPDVKAMEVEPVSPTYAPYSPTYAPNSPTYSPNSPTYAPKTPPPVPEVEPDLNADCAFLIAAARESFAALALQSAHVAGDGTEALLADAVGEQAYEAHRIAAEFDLTTPTLNASEQAECELSLAELQVANSGAGNIACDAPVMPTDLFAYQPAQLACPTAVGGW